ncbi:MAG: hypothetical protein IPJ17_21620 [Holophagales bacterium]|nr:MAG: hypothetical protein IPJ17_21620 [Holophagales bacterium]
MTWSPMARDAFARASSASSCGVTAAASSVLWVTNGRSRSAAAKTMRFVRRSNRTGQPKCAS